MNRPFPHLVVVCSKLFCVVNEQAFYFESFDRKKSLLLASRLGVNDERESGADYMISLCVRTQSCPTTAPPTAAWPWPRSL